MSFGGDGAIMQSKNFEFLRPNWEDLATLGAFAEQYAHPDPPSAVAKLRTFAEQVVQFIYHKHGLPKPYQCNLNDLLTNASFAQVVPKVISSKLHSLRIHGNKAAHGESVLASDRCLAAPGSLRIGPLDAPELRQGEARQTARRSPLPAHLPGTEAEKKLKQEKVPILATAGGPGSRDAEAPGRPGSRPFHSRWPRRRPPNCKLRHGPRPTGRRYPRLRRGDDPPPPHRQPARVCRLGCRGQGSQHRSRWARSSRSIISRPPPARARPITSSGATTASRSASSRPRRPPSIPRAAAPRPSAMPMAWKRCTASARHLLHERLRHLDLERCARASRPASSTASIPRTVSNTCTISGRTGSHSPRSSRTRTSPAGCTRSRPSSGSSSDSPPCTGKALIVQATGTGKTRVAVSLCELLLRASWAKRILFLCDRRELRKQAHNVFKEFLPGEPRTYVTVGTPPRTGTTASTLPPTRR